MPRTGAPFATIQKRGIISLNEPACTALGNPPFVVLMYDVEQNLIGIRPALEEDAEYAYTLREGKTRVVSAQAFAKHYGLDVSESRRRSVEVVDGVLTIDLNDPGTLVVGARAKKKRDTGDANVDGRPIRNSQEEGPGPNRQSRLLGQ